MQKLMKAGVVITQAEQQALDQDFGANRTEAKLL
jgi:hypothetical protein